MLKKRILLMFGLMIFPLVGSLAKPVAPAAFCAHYPDTPVCTNGFASCDTCHTTAPARNAYGDSLAIHLLLTVPLPHTDDAFLEGLPGSLDAVADFDADLDGYSNLEELNAGSKPSDVESVPNVDICDEDTRRHAEHPGNGWNVCGYDRAYVYKKIYLDFCGRSPTFKEANAFKALGDEQDTAIDEALGSCLVSDFWLGQYGVLWNLANDKIRPAASIKSGANAGPIPLGDYDEDYNLFVYTQSGDRDVREMLTAQYYVERIIAEDDSPDTFMPFTRGAVVDFSVRGFDRAQLTEPETRAGLLTTRWFLVNFTMFTSIPRTSAAQAYRSYLGFDISKMEGLQAVADEPVDYDAKGVGAPDCAVCHSTLDPLTYPFSRYDGLGGGAGSLIGDPTGQGQDTDEIIGPNGELNLTVASYTADRLERFRIVDGDLVAQTPEAGILLGQPVENLVEWAEVASNSEAFAQNVVRDYWVLLMGQPPLPSEISAYEQLWRGLMGEHEYRVERMLKALVRTEAYGAP